MECVIIKCQMVKRRKKEKVRYRQYMILLDQIGFEKDRLYHIILEIA